MSKSLICCLAMLLLGLSGLSEAVDPVLAAGPWAQFKRDARNSGLSPYQEQGHALKWIFEAGKSEWMILSPSPVIGADGTIYFITIGKKQPAFTLYAVNPNGSLKWKSHIAYSEAFFMYADGPVPAIGPDGAIHYPVKGRLYAINPDGTHKWYYDTGHNIFSNPAIADDGTIYFGSYGGDLYALQPDGTLKWTFAIPGGDLAVEGAPAIAPDGTVYFANENFLYALNPNGTLKWKHEADVYRIDAFSLRVGSKGTIYFDAFGVDSTGLYAVNPDGSLKWTYAVPGAVFDSSIGADGTIYLNSALDDTLRAVHPDGSGKWSYPVSISGFPMSVGGDGTIYFNLLDIYSTDDSLYAVSPNGTFKWAYKLFNEWIDSTAVIGGDGTIYFTTTANRLYALGKSFAPARRPGDGEVDLPSGGIDTGADPVDDPGFKLPMYRQLPADFFIPREVPWWWREGIEPIPSPGPGPAPHEQRGLFRWEDQVLIYEGEDAFPIEYFPEEFRSEPGAYRWSGYEPENDQRYYIDPEPVGQLPDEEGYRGER